MKKQKIVSGATLVVLTQIVLQSPCMADMPPYHNRPRPQPLVEEPKKPQAPTEPAKKPEGKNNHHKAEGSENKTKKETSKFTTTK